MKVHILFFIIFIFPFVSISQQNEEQEDFAMYEEISFGINFHTNGGLIGGAGVRYAIPQNNDFFHILNLELVNIKHKKEAQFSSALTGNSFIPEKLNYLLSLRPSYGREYVLFQKYPEAGVRVTGVFVAGPSFGITKPYYIEYQYDINNVEFVAYNPSLHNLGNIRGNGSFLYGLNELNLHMGAHLKTGVFFELSQTVGSVSGIEFGMHLEGFFDSIPIYNIEENKNLYSAVYIVLHYGKQK